MTFYEIKALRHLNIDPHHHLYFWHHSSDMDMGNFHYVTVVWTENGDTELMAIVHVPVEEIACTTIVRIER